jgi:hypothetical protein
MWKSGHTFVSVSQSILDESSVASFNTHQSSRQNTNITWGPCENYEFTSPLECGGYIVPVDWTDFSVGYIELELIRLRSSSEEPRGSIFVNFGGPGENGRSSLDSLGPIMMSMTGGCYDLVSITPRYVLSTAIIEIKLF